MLTEVCPTLLWWTALLSISVSGCYGWRITTQTTQYYSSSCVKIYYCSLIFKKKVAVSCFELSCMSD